MERLTGIGVSSGMAIGPALVAIQRTQVIRFPVSAEGVGREVSALEHARTRSREQLLQIRARVAALRGTELASIFDAQLLLLDDTMLMGRTTELVRDERVNAEWAVQHAFEEIADVFDDVADPYLSERKGDLHDVAGRLRMNLRDEKSAGRHLLHDIETPGVLIADELTASVVAQLDWTRIRGFATDAGSRTYHTAILARSLGVPAVVGLHDVSLRVPPGAWVIIDGETGEVTVNPTAAVRQDAEARVRLSRARSLVVRPSEGPTLTKDGVRVTLDANIERLDDLAAARGAGADGIGLYRSEFLLAGGLPELIDEDRQLEAYVRLLEAMPGRLVTVRTFDVDARHAAPPHGDSVLAARWFPDADRPASRGGLRGIRFGLANPAILKTQLRALLRAAPHGRLRIMFPFVSTLEDVRGARRLLDEARAELTARDVDVPAVPVGVMIEVPSAAITAASLAREADFFMIGTNDLIQYTLAVDRTDEHVSDRYQPLHPAILRLIRHVRRGAAARGIPVSVCGEMAADPMLVQLLIGCGVTAFSMTPGALDMVRRIVRETGAGEMRRVAAAVLKLETVEAIERYLAETVSVTGGRGEGAETSAVSARDSS